MDDLERPPFHPYELEQIEVQFHDVDKRFWAALRDLQVETPFVVAGFTLGGPGKPAPPKRPEELKVTLWQYADSLFYVEASKYPKPDERLRRWLENLASRLETRVLRQVRDLERGSFQRNLSYHQLSNEEMLEAVQEGLAASIEKWCPVESLNHSRALSPSVIATPRNSPATRLSGTVTSLTAARKLEAHLAKNCLGMTEFANLVPTTDRTLRSFRKTGKVRRDIFEGIAKAMGTTKERLLAD